MSKTFSVLDFTHCEALFSMVFILFSSWKMNIKCCHSKFIIFYVPSVESSWEDREQIQNIHQQRQMNSEVWGPSSLNFKNQSRVSTFFFKSNAIHLCTLNWKHEFFFFSEKSWTSLQKVNITLPCSLHSEILC